MEFTTKTEPYTGEKISAGEKGFSIGSCFAENIAGKLAVSGFDITSNPFGVLYNPASIAGAMEILASGRIFKISDLVRNGEMWCSPFFHGSFSGTDAETVLEKMNNAVSEGREALTEASFVLISFGTPGIYTVSKEFADMQNAIAQGETVANCHKLPARYYDCSSMDVGEITSMYDRLSTGILKGKKMIYTVSPVRYLKDGLHGSNLGKATLLLAVEAICCANPGSYYFPAYEILTDELRDYRFYAADMVHPSPTAVDYIWEIFRNSALTPHAGEAAREIEKVSAGMFHRVKAPGTDEHIKYLRSMEERVVALGKKYPAADLCRHSAFFTAELKKYETE